MLSSSKNKVSNYQELQSIDFRFQWYKKCEN